MTSIDHLRHGRNLVENEQRRGNGADPLPRLLSQLIKRAGDPATIERATSRPWASASNGLSGVTRSVSRIALRG